jgi:hypothetical protein
VPDGGGESEMDRILDEVIAKLRLEWQNGIEARYQELE